MMLTDRSYFKGSILIPDADTTGPAGGSVSLMLQQSIEQHEPILLTYIMGATLYAQLLAGLEESEIEAKWTALKAQIINQTKETSVIAPLIYYHFRRDNATTVSMFGDAFSMGENSRPASMNEKLVSVWNQGRARVIELIKWLSEHMEDYPDWELRTVTGVASIDSLIDYLEYDLLILEHHNRIGI